MISSLRRPLVGTAAVELNEDGSVVALLALRLVVVAGAFPPTAGAGAGAEPGSGTAFGIGRALRSAKAADAGKISRTAMKCFNEKNCVFSGLNKGNPLKMFSSLHPNVVISRNGGQFSLWSTAKLFVHFNPINSLSPDCLLKQLPI